MKNRLALRTTQSFAYVARMILLAIEQSTSTGSIAILSGDALLAHGTWKVEKQARNRIYDAVREACRDARISLSDVEAFAVGIGPGTYSGLRISNSVIHGLALPSEAPVVGVSSGEALALRLLSDTTSTVSIVGDARRDRIWLGRFVLNGGATEQTTDWSLIPFSELPTETEANERIAGPDWASLEDVLREHYPEPSLETAPAIPDAEQVAQIAQARLKGGDTSPATEIIYVHPAVFVEPKFPAT